ncbi:hypothetical protein RIR_jg30009.t1 [Rhizophagus irregularis DAOM 181602=DAOM 197198]|nr:hypothetical protein RIR_jg30009.t1 [Rhizophagus irregularis DAOM 181602=DAOM 197198]
MKLEKLFDLIIMIIFFLSWLKSNLPNNEVTRISEILSYGNFLFSLIFNYFLPENRIFMVILLATSVSVFMCLFCHISSSCCTPIQERFLENWLIIFINFNVKFIIFGLLRRCVQENIQRCNYLR